MNNKRAPVDSFWPRLWRHMWMTRWQVRRTFPSQALKAIEQAIVKTEQTQGGEIRFAVEGELETVALLKQVSPRQRAIQLFAQLGVWDTADNNGVLIYLLLADRTVEIVADRGFTDKVSAAEWLDVCHRIERAFHIGNFRDGVIDGIQAVGELIARHYPARDNDELSNTVVVL